MRRGGGAVRSRLLELRRQLDGARAGREVLERKRELLLAELRRRDEARRAARARVAELLAAARARLAAARVELGSPMLDGALLAQPVGVTVAWRMGSLLGVAVPAVALHVPPFEPRYGAAGTCAALDEAGTAYVEVVEAVGRLADEEAAWHAVRRGLQRCVRQLSALEKVVMPEVEAEVRAVGAALEEEERDEGMRRRRFVERR